MIKSFCIDENFVENNVFLTKIKSDALAFKDFDFSKTYFQEVEDKITAYIGILGENANVYVIDNKDTKEIVDFLLFYGVKSVFSNYEFCNESGIVLKYEKKGDEKDEFKPTAYPDYKSAYNILNKTFSMPEYNEFVSDLSYKISHNHARFIANENGLIYTLWETRDFAVISAIAVDEKNRNNGVGSRLLKSMVASLRDKEIYVYCEEKTKDFYIKNGFEPTDRYFTGELK